MPVFSITITSVLPFWPDQDKVRQLFSAVPRHFTSSARTHHMSLVCEDVDHPKLRVLIFEERVGDDEAELRSVVDEVVRTQLAPLREECGLALTADSDVNVAITILSREFEDGEAAPNHPDTLQDVEDVQGLIEAAGSTA